MANCVMCGSPIPDNQGSRSCSMCYGDVDHGKDGYYREWLEEQSRRAEAEAETDYTVCKACNGTGRGQGDNTYCGRCGGDGTHPAPEQGVEPPESAAAAPVPAENEDLQFAQEVYAQFKENCMEMNEARLTTALGIALSFAASAPQEDTHRDEAAIRRAAFDEAIAIVAGEHLEEPTDDKGDVAYELAIQHVIEALESARDTTPTDDPSTLER